MDIFDALTNAELDWVSAKIAELAEKSRNGSTFRDTSPELKAINEAIIFIGMSAIDQLAYLAEHDGPPRFYIQMSAGREGQR